MRNLSLITFLAVASQLTVQSCRNFPGITICVGLTPKSGPHLEVNETSFAVLHGNMSVLQATFFNRLTHLERLYFNTTNVWKIEKGALASLHKLKVLGLTGNKITSIEEGAFSNCSSLETLDLTGNDIEFNIFLLFAPLVCLFGSSYQRCISTVATTECDGASFSRGHPVKLDSYRNFVQFKGSNIEEIPSGTFRLLPEVSSLYLSFNTIKKLEPGSFEGLPKLSQLVLNHNSLEIIVNGVFRDCTNLRMLDLGANKIKTIERSAFSELINLEEIVLSFNQLESVPESVAVLVKVKKIDLSNNKIKSVESNVFTKLNSLEVLSLESNKIRYVQDDAFKGLNKLQEINLKDNYLSNLNAANLINNLKSLKTIKLSINDFVCKTLKAIIDEFEARNIKVTRGVSKADVTINGIACKLQ